MTTTTPPPPPDAGDYSTSSQELLSIAKVSQCTGLSEAVLRAWESRYGWPRPLRGENGYRQYPGSLIAVLQRVAEEVRGGRAIGDLLRDPAWQAIMESGRLPEAKPPRAMEAPDWSTIPWPESPHGRDVRTRLERALLTRDMGLVAWAQAEAGRLRPLEREHAVLALLRLWQQQA